MVPPKINIITSIYIISDLLKLRMLSSFQKMELNLECRFWHIFKGRYFFGKVSLLFAAWHFQIGILSFSRSLYTKIYSIIIHICNVYIIISMYVSICVYVYIYMYIHVKYIYIYTLYIYISMHEVHLLFPCSPCSVAPVAPVRLPVAQGKWLQWWSPWWWQRNMFSLTSI